METSHNPGLPPLFGRHVRRPRLTRALDESTAQAILLTAPAGYGKTALAAEWLETTRHVAWYRATQSSADVAALSVGLADAVAHFMPGAGDRLRRRVRMGDAPEKIVRSLAELLAEDLAEWPQGAWMVIDDYHLVMPSKPSEEFVDWLLMLTPVRLLVTTRQRPTWATARRLLSGEFFELTKDQLAMTKPEASEALAGQPSKAVRVLLERAEGWPALVGLGLVPASSQISESSVLGNLYRYFAEEVLREETEDAQQLLTAASIAPTFDAAFAFEVAGVASPQATLHRLSSIGLIEGTLPDFFLHPLLREFLRARLQHTYRRDALEALYDRTIAFAQATNRPNWAFDVAIHTDRRDMAAHIATRAAPDLLVAGKLETLAAWLGKLGPLIDTRPALALAQADVLTRLGDLSGAAVIAERVAEHAHLRGRHTSRAWCLASRAHHLGSNPQRALEASVKALASARTRRDRYEAQWRALCAAKDLGLPDHERYLRDFEHVADASPDARVRVACGRISLASGKGSFAGLSQDLAPLLAQLDQVSDPMIMLGSLIAFIDLALVRSDYTAALTLSSRGLEIARSNRVNVAIGPLVAERAHSLIGLRQLAQAQAAVNELYSIAKRDGDSYVMLAYHANVTRLSILQNACDPEQFDTSQLKLAASLRIYLANYLGLTSLVAAANGRSTIAIDRSEQAVEIANTGETRAYKQLTEIIVEARTAWSSQRVAKHAATLIKSHRERDFVDPFVMAYRAYPPLLSSLHEDPGAWAIAQDLLVASHDCSLAVEIGLSLTAATAVEHLLTPREQEVMILLDEGCTNREIAQRLVISYSTAKVHVHHILRKLGARNRLELILEHRRRSEPT